MNTDRRGFLGAIAAALAFPKAWLEKGLTPYQTLRSLLVDGDQIGGMVRCSYPILTTPWAYNGADFFRIVWREAVRLKRGELAAG